MQLLSNSDIELVSGGFTYGPATMVVDNAENGALWGLIIGFFFPPITASSLLTSMAAGAAIGATFGMSYAIAQVIDNNNYPASPVTVN